MAIILRKIVCLCDNCFYGRAELANELLKYIEPDKLNNTTQMSNLTIYMKSGNTIIADKVIDWNIKYTTDAITYLHIDQRTSGLFKCKRKVIIGSIDLNQIECVVEH